MRLPEGQRALILVKLEDIVSADDPHLLYAAAEFLELLVHLGIMLDKDSYERIAGPAFERAFEYEYDGRLGRKGLRTAIDMAAAAARGEVFEVLVNAAVKFVQSIPLDEREGWYLHGLRDILQSLLANPACTKGAVEIAGALRAVNKAQRKTQG